MASNFDAILAQTNPQALAVHTGYSSFAPAPSAPKPQAPAPQSSLFHSIAQAALHNKAEHVVGSAGKGLVTSTIGAAQTVGRAGIVNPARLGAAEITHNTTALNNVGKSIVQNTPGKVIGAGLQTASLALPGGGKIGETVGAKVLPAALARATAVGAKAAPAGALFGAGQGISEGKKPLQVAKGAAVGGLTAGALGGAGSLLGSTISKVKGGPLPLPRKSPEINATPVRGATQAGKGSGFSGIMNKSATTIQTLSKTLRGKQSTMPLGEATSNAQRTVNGVEKNRPSTLTTTTTQGNLKSTGSVPNAIRTSTDNTRELTSLSTSLTSHESPKLSSPQQVAKDYFANKSKATADYQAHTMKEFGVDKPNIVSADSAKFIVKGGQMNPSHSVPFHEPASQFSKDYYKNLLADKSTKDQPVLFTGGGSGAGKTHALVNSEGGKLNNYAAIVDTNLTDVPGSIKKIGQALDTGRKVQVNYVYRHPIDAFRKGVLRRAEQTGRTVPIDIHAETHVGSLDTVQKLAEHYKDNPNFSVRVLDNSGDIVSKQPIDFLKDKVYDKTRLQKDLHDQLNQAHQQGEISAETYHASKPGSDSGHANSVSEQTGLSKVGKSVQQKAVERGLKDTYGDSASYEKISLADQAKKAVELTNDRPELEKVISGEKPLPNGLRATALVKAVEDHPVLGKDPELLNKLSKSDLTTESSQSAQELRLARERNPDSVTARLNEVRKAKMAAVEAKLKTPIAKAITSTAKEAKGFIPKVKADEWSNFVESLKC